MGYRLGSLGVRSHFGYRPGGVEGDQPTGDDGSLLGLIDSVL